LATDVHGVPMVGMVGKGYIWYVGLSENRGYHGIPQSGKWGIRVTILT
jgi:hypothetical protein